MSKLDLFTHFYWFITNDWMILSYLDRIKIKRINIPGQNSNSVVDNFICLKEKRYFIYFDFCFIFIFFSFIFYIPRILKICSWHHLLGNIRLDDEKDATHHYHHRIINRLIIITYMNFAGQLDPDMRSQKRYSFLFLFFVLIVILVDVSGP